MNLPILLTLTRIFIIPVFVVIYLLPSPWAHGVASGLFAVAALTDWLDGYLARSLQQTTALGAFLDPVADKLLVAAALVLIVGQYSMPSLSVAATVIVMREIAISALREWMADMGHRTSVAVSFLAKIKTTLQMTALIVLIGFTRTLCPLWIFWLGHLLLLIAAGLTLWTMIIYLRMAWPDLTLSQKKQ